jgi:Uma2 family endonuclease
MARQFVTPEQYLADERRADFKSEYIDGEVYAMTGASLAHNTITSNLMMGMGEKVRGGPCRPFSSDMRVKTADAFLYPDLVVVCGAPVIENDGGNDNLLNPTLILEVLSPSTEAFDRGAKFAHYRTLPSLQAYVLIAQDRVCVEAFTRPDTGDHWHRLATTDPEGLLHLPAIFCTLSLSEIYRDVSTTASN